MTIEGRATQYVRVGDSGGRGTHSFCPTCGSTACWEIDSMPGVVAVAIGAFADPEFPAPRVSVYEARRHAWALPDLELPEESARCFLTTLISGGGGGAASCVPPWDAGSDVDASDSTESDAGTMIMDAARAEDAGAVGDTVKGRSLK